MSVKLKILEDRKSSQVRKVDGLSGKLYPFNWDNKVRAYVYAPRNQDELDDIMERAGSTTFAPVVDWGAVSAPKAPVVSEEEKSQLAVLLGVLRMAGIESQPDDTVKIAQRLLRAYDKGREDEKAQTVEPKTAPVIQPIVPAAQISALPPVVEVPLAQAIPTYSVAKANRGTRSRGAGNATA